uniref:S8 family serine peptidase n=1 Tax=Trichloromonas sp. TaxID=3069249 RepID=UPI003D81641A
MSRFSKVFFWALSAATAFCLVVCGGDVWAKDKPVEVAGELLIQYKTGVSSGALAGELKQLGVTMAEELSRIKVHRIKVKEANREKIKAVLAKNPRVAFVEDNFYASAVAVPDDDMYPSQWHLPRIAAPAGWDISTGTTMVPIAVIDSGVDPSHPDLATKLLPGYNFIAYNTDTHDVKGHGTAVAGAAGALSDNGLGVSGVAWHNPIMPLVVLDANGSGPYSAIASAITWAADRGAKVINLSLAGPYASSTLQNAIDYAWAKGAVIVAAAANEATSTPYYPAACNNVVAVSASDKNDNLASFSNYGPWIDVAAPGTTIYTTSNGGSYGGWNGTSFSSPITAGLVALIWSANPLLTNAEVVDILKQGADDLGAPGFDSSFGHGRINVLNSLTLALGYAPVPDTQPPSVTITAPSVAGPVNALVSIRVAAVDDVGVDHVDFFVNGMILGSDQTAPYSLVWDAKTVADGWYTITAKAYDVAGNVGES